MMSHLRRAALLLLVLLAGCTAKPSTEPIQVAHLLPLTGPDKRAAEDARRGMLLAVEEVNADTQRLGRTVVVRNIDSRGDPEVIQAEVVRLVTLNKVVAFVAGPDSRGAERLARTAQSYALPVIVPGDFPPATGVEGFIALSASPATRGEALAKYAVKELKAKRVLVMTDQRIPIAVALSAAFVNEWPRAAPPTIEEWPFRNDTERADLASRLLVAGPVVALFAGSQADFLKLHEQLQEKNAKVTLLYGGEDLDTSVLRKPTVEAVLATVYSPDGLTEKGKEFAKRYEERFHEPPTLEAVQAYDAGRLLFDHLHLLKSGGPTRVRDELMRLAEFESSTAKITWKDGKGQRPLFIVQVKNGEAKVVQTIPVEE